LNKLTRTFNDFFLSKSASLNYVPAPELRKILFSHINCHNIIQ